MENILLLTNKFEMSLIFIFDVSLLIFLYTQCSEEAMYFEKIISTVLFKKTYASILKTNSCIKGMVVRNSSSLSHSKLLNFVIIANKQEV